MPLPTDRNPGDPIQSADIDAIATQVNTNETDIAGKLDIDGGNLTDGGAALLAALAMTPMKVQTSGIASVGWFFGAATPSDAVADATDIAVWVIPVGS